MKKIYLGFFFHISHSFQCGVILTPKTRRENFFFFFYIPSEQLNQARCVCIDRECMKSHKILFH